MDYTSGKSTISRAGFSCYLKSALLAKEKEMLEDNSKVNKNKIKRCLGGTINFS